VLFSVKYFIYLQILTMWVKNIMLLFSWMIFKLIRIVKWNITSYWYNKSLWNEVPGRMQEAVAFSERKDTLWKSPCLRHLICTMVHAWHWITRTWSSPYCLGSFVLHVWEREQVKRKTLLGRHMTWICFNDLL
jgi:hypothetical protein